MVFPSELITMLRYAWSYHEECQARFRGGIFTAKGAKNAKVGEEFLDRMYRINRI